jgi:hypothetical protein
MGVVQFRLATLVRTAEPGAGAKTRLTKKENDFSILFRVAHPEALRWAWCISGWQRLFELPNRGLARRPG